MSVAKHSSPRRRPITIVLVIILLLILLGAGGYIILQSGQKPAASPAPAAAKASPISLIDKKLSQLSLREKVARLFIFHQAGTDLTTLQNFLTTYQPGGFILMGDNIPASDTVLKSLTATLRGDDTSFPRLVATDEEGGTVKRLAGDTFASALTLKNLPVSATTSAFTSRSAQLERLGVTLNFGIIADNTADPQSFIFPRVLGTTPPSASSRVAAAVTASAGKTLSTLKHFPGHGETKADSHITIPTITITKTAWQQRDKPPFQAGINAGADLVMMGHLRYSAVDSAPASLSAKWHDILRQELGFKGIIVTDDMFMLKDSGNPAYADLAQDAVTALAAGNTMLLYVNDHGNGTTLDPTHVIDTVVTAVQNGTLQQSTIDQDVRLVLMAQAKTASF